MGLIEFATIGACVLFVGAITLIVLSAVKAEGNMTRKRYK